MWWCSFVWRGGIGVCGTRVGSGMGKVVMMRGAGDV